MFGDSMKALVRDLLDTYARTGAVALAPDRREMVAGALQRMAREYELAEWDDLFRFVRTERDARGLRQSDLEAPVTDEVMAGIVEAGFVGLDGITLGRLLLCPDDLRAVLVELDQRACPFWMYEP